MDDKDKPLPFVQSLLEMQEEYFDIIKEQAQDYDNLDIPEDFIASRKRGAGVSVEMRKLSISMRFGGYGNDRVKLDKLFDYNMPIFWGTAEDEYTLDNARELYKALFNGGMVRGTDYSGDWNLTGSANNKSSIMFIQLAKNNVKYMKHCKKAFHVSTFKAKMLPRKEKMVRQYFQTSELVNRYDNLDSFYMDADSIFTVISPKWQSEIKTIHQYFEAIPEEAKNRNIHYIKDQLVTFYNLEDIKPSGMEQIITKKMEKIEKLSTENEKTLSYIDIPYHADKDNVDKELIDILKKVMVL